MGKEWGIRVVLGVLVGVVQVVVVVCGSMCVGWQGWWRWRVRRTRLLKGR